MFFSVQYVYASHRSPYGIRLDGERNLIGWRTESDWVANGIRLGGERDLVAKRKKPQHQTRYCGFRKFMNKATL